VLQQCATPRELYAKPNNVFVAGFMGSPAMNLFTLPVTEGVVELGGQQIALPRSVTSGAAEVVLGIRPEHLEPASSATLMEEESGIAMEVDVIEELGSDAYVYGRTQGPSGELQIVSRVDWRKPPAKGARLHLQAAPAQIHLFSASSGERLM